MTLSAAEDGAAPEDPISRAHLAPLDAPATPASHRAHGSWRSKLAAVGAAISIAAVYLWDDLIFAAPILTATRLLGALPAFLILSVVYAVASLVLALFAVHVYDRRSAGDPSRFARWLERQGQNQRSSWIRNLLLSGKVIGFVLASFLLGGVGTTFLIRYSGRTDRIVPVAILSSALFGVMFVGFYSGIGRITIGS